jgi:hypothetical protein
MIRLYSTRCWRRRVGRPLPRLRVRVPVCRHAPYVYTPRLLPAVLTLALFFFSQHLNVRHNPRQMDPQAALCMTTSRPNCLIMLPRLRIMMVARLLVVACVHIAPLKTHTAEMIARYADCHSNVVRKYHTTRARVWICVRIFIECCCTYHNLFTHK